MKGGGDGQIDPLPLKKNCPQKSPALLGLMRITHVSHGSYVPSLTALITKYFHENSPLFHDLRSISHQYGLLRHKN